MLFIFITFPRNFLKNVQKQDLPTLFKVNVNIQGQIQDFPERGRQPTIQPNFPENCMKMKKFEPGDERSQFYYVDPPLQ